MIALNSIRLKVIFIVSIILITCFGWLDSSGQSRNNPLNKSMKLKYKIDAEVASQDSGRLNYLYGRFFYFPKSDKRQQVMKVGTLSDPVADSINIDRAYFEWRTLHKKYSFSYMAEVETKAYMFPIKDEPFPVTRNLELDSYYKFDSFINKSEVLSLLSMALTEGEQTLLGAVTSIGEWIHENIKYKGELLRENIQYAEGSYSGYLVSPASTIVTKMSGLSIEFSTLFMSLLRCAEIPVRFISGVAQINGKMKQHAWVEVYFAESGWIPFDPVSGQFGFVDATHVTLNSSRTIPQILKHEWRYYPYFGDIEIPVVKEPVIFSEIKEASSMPINPVDVSISSLANEVGHKSYVPIVITVRNRKPFSVADRIVIPSPPNVVVEGHLSKLVTLRPYEEKQISYLIKLNDGYSKSVDYHAFLKVSDQFGSADSVLVSFEKEGLVYSEKQCMESLDTLSIFEGFNATNISFSTKSVKKYYFTDETPYFTSEIHEPVFKTVQDINVISSVKKSFSYKQAPTHSDTIKAHINERYLFPCMKDSGRMVCRPVIFNRIKAPKLFFQIYDLGKASEKRRSRFKFEVYAIGDLRDIQIIYHGDELIGIEQLEGELSEVIVLPTRLKMRSKIKFEVNYTDKDGNVYNRKYYKKIITPKLLPAN
ncbi:transglutaminase domain-containing protein [Prolixibacteraceae bacterium JC049]|nr:transglutaminase domain-containing protein [Prolixibacteraceae bacterium JC049]